MKRSQTIVTLCMALPLITGCHSMPDYRGDGLITNTTTRHDGLVRIPEYTIHLVSFELNTDVEREFILGNVAFFRATTVCIYVRFIDDHTWWHFSKLHPSETTPGYVQEFRLRDLDKIQSRLKYQVVAEGGNELFRSDKLLGDYIWGSKQLERRWKRIGIYDPANARTEIPNGANLKLLFSYKGDPLLTNRADLVVICWPK